ncbi:hypothetical protein Mapa_017307 [Marchantia paleacea]|nr:hypothetical protein Mapa_017307 [Marchantia paleacea]
MDPLYAWLESQVLPKIRWKFSKESCYATEPMPKALWFLTLAIIMLGIHTVDAKGFEYSSVNSTSPVSPAINNLTRPLGVACLPSGSWSSRRLLQEDALYRYFVSTHEAHYYKHLYRRPMSSYKLTGRIPRKDPLDNFHVYDGGFNVTDKHYWSNSGWGYILGKCQIRATAPSYSWYAAHGH